MTAAGFEAFGPQRRGKRFATSWWGQAWIQAMEDAALDQVLLRKGRAYAKRGVIGPITLSPGRIASHAEEYAVVVRIPRLTDAEWDRFAEAAASRAGHLADLLDGDLPHDLAGDVPLLPVVGDLDAECDCGDWQCRHAAAVCYQVSWLLDDDPFLLLLLRGRSRDELLDALAAPPSGVRAAEVFAEPPGPLPGPPPRGPFTPPLTGGPPGVDVDALVRAAAQRARDLLGWDGVGAGR